MNNQNTQPSTENDNGVSFDEEIAGTLRRIAEHLAAIRESQRNNSREWLTIANVAEELQVSKDTVERLVAAGHLRAAMLSTPRSRGWRRRYRVHRDWVAEFLLASVSPAPPTKKSVHRSGNHVGAAIFLE